MGSPQEHTTKPWSLWFSKIHSFMSTGDRQTELGSSR